MLKKVYIFFTFIIMFNFFSFGKEIEKASDTYILEANEVIKADKTTYIAEGNVILKAKGIIFSADKVIYNPETEDIHAIGNVKIKNNNQQLESEEIKYNAKTEQGTASNVKGILAPVSYICAKKMEKTGEKSFIIHDARISTCSGDIPDWSIYMYYGKMDIDGFINASHASADILNTPLLYTPKLLYPVSTKRKSGFLFPKLGISDEKGAIIGLQYFWAPTVDFDATFGLNWYSKRGLHQLIEARYKHSENDSFYAAFSRIDDIAKEAAKNSRWRAILGNRFYPAENLEITINAHYASDYMYTRDFGKYSISKFYEENKDNMFYEEIRAKYYSNFADFSINYRNDYIYRDTSNKVGYNKTGLEKAPSINISKTITDIPYVIFDYNISYDKVKYSYYSYENNFGSYPEDAQWQYNRFNSDASLYVPVDFKYFVLTPMASVQYTRWDNSSKKFTADNYFSSDFGHIKYLNSQSAERLYGKTGISLAPRIIYRNYGSVVHSMQNVTEIKHSPKLVQDTEGKINIPNYLYDDRLPYYTSISHTLVNYLTYKNWTASLKLKQEFDFTQKVPELPLNGTMSISMAPYIASTLEFQYKHSGNLDNKAHEQRLQYISESLTVKPTDNFRIMGIYSYDTRLWDEDKEGYLISTQLDASLSFWRFLLRGYTKMRGYNKKIIFNNLASYEQYISLTYRADCWSIGFAIDRETYNINKINDKYKRDDITLYLTFALHGIGSTDFHIKNTNDKILNDY